MKSSRIVRIAHLSLVIAATFALLAFGVILVIEIPTAVRVNRMSKRAEADQKAAEKQAHGAAHTTGIILSRVAVITDETAKITVAEQAYWNQQNKQMAALFRNLNKSADGLNADLEALHETIQTGNDAVKTLSYSGGRLLDDANENLQTLVKTQRKLDVTVEAFNTETIPRINAELDEAHAATVQATGTLRNTKEMMGHGNNIIAHYDRKVNTKRGVLSTIGHWGMGFAASVMADIVALQAVH